jgi:putative flippase GtrA
MTELLRQSIRFATVGLANTAIGLAAIYAVMFFFQTGPAIANAIGYAIGLAVSFSLNRVWTFNSDRPVGHVLPKFLLVAALSYLLNLGAVVAAASHSVNPYLAQLLGVGIYTVCVFFGCRWFVFAPRRTA